MASIGGGGGRRDAFPVVNASRELNLGVPEEFPVDPISFDVANAKKLEEEEEARARTKAEEAKKCKFCIGDVLMSTLTVSIVVAAAVGVAFFVQKKWKLV